VAAAVRARGSTLWTRNLFEGATRAPAVEKEQRVMVFDRRERDYNGLLASRATWLEAVGLHMTTKYRAFVVLDAAEAAKLPSITDSFVYEPFTAVIANCAKQTR
jgi:hypothetical protein